jgi:DNA-binding NarL/FixJ family response regulator
LAADASSHRSQSADPGGRWRGSGSRPQEPRPPASIRVVVAEPASPFRNRIGLILAGATGFDVAAVGTSDGLLKACVFHPPTVVLVATSLPPDGAITTVERLTEAAPTVRSVVWTGESDIGAALAALRVGARGVLARDVTPGALIRSLRQVAAGHVLLPRSVVGPVIDQLQNDYRRGPAQHVSTLSRRERQVLALIGDGHSNRAIADRLGIAEPTVKRHVHNVLKKLDARSRAAAANIYGSAGIGREGSTANGGS